jgi:sugar/nucleoside kinase (ribokinase family)
MNKTKINVLLIGGAVADIIAAGLPKVADPGQSAQPSEGIQLHVGGHPTNISRDLVKLGLPPPNIYLAAAIGHDVFGQFIEAELRKFKINLNLQKIGRIDTSKNVILVVKGEKRRNHLAPGASHYLDLDVVIDLLREVKPSLFYAGALGGRLNETIGVVLREAQQMGCLTFLDTPLPSRKKARDILMYTNILHLNDLEASQYSGINDVKAASELFMQQGVQMAFITFGEGGALVRTKRLGLRQQAFNVSMIDPTGPGDAFCSGILYRLYHRLENKLGMDLTQLSLTDLREMMLFGQAVGAVCVTGVGTTTAISFVAVSKLIEEQGEDVRKSTRSLLQ